MGASHTAGRVAIVTGASSGIGEAAAIAFAEAGIAVVLAARRLPRLDALSEKIRAKGGVALPVAADVTDEQAVLHLFETALKHFSKVDILVNNAGVVDHTPTDELTLARWHEVINANLTSAFLCSREAMKIMKTQGSGRIVHVGSLSSMVPRAGTLAYAVSKFGMDGLNHSLAIDGRAHGVVSSIFRPGIVMTELVIPTRPMPPTAYIDAEVAGRAVLAMVDLPDHVNFFEAVMLPSSMPFLGRG
jgi:NAD(P)-dependent dehydrogenase (short-subunit alcohol dehydrogenase family)